MILEAQPFEKKLSFGERGFSSITEESHLSIPSAIAGKESVTKFIHNN